MVKTSLANLLLQILPGLTSGEFVGFGILAGAGAIWWRWILRNHRVPPDAVERLYKS